MTLFGWLKTIECFNPILKKWATVSEIKDELSSCACAEMGGKLYMTGGKNSSNRAVPTVLCFDPSDKQVPDTT